MILQITYSKKLEVSMNWLVLISGLVAAFCTVGHFAIGSKQYLQPMLQASFDDVAKKVMHCVFHYVSVYLVLSTAFLIAVGFGYKFNIAVTQLIIAATSKIPNAVFKMFQWIIFVVIAVFAWLGA
jgi:hypothetical protein